LPAGAGPAGRGLRDRIRRPARGRHRRRHMKRFAALYAELDESTSTDDKLAALRRYLREAPDEDAAWAVYFLSGGRPPRLIRTARLKAVAMEAAGLPEWLFEASHQAVGDLAATLALVLPDTGGCGHDAGLSDWMLQRLLPLRGADEARIVQALPAWLSELDPPGRFLLVKLVSGGFR